MLPAGFSLGPMRADEVPLLGEWASREGWNPGRADLDLAWQFDPGAFVALRQDETLAAGGTTLRYGGRFGFMGLYIVRPDLRGEGFGRTMCTYLLERMQARLDPGAAIGIDGVFAMVPFYERCGFRLAHRDLRFEGVATGEADPAVTPLDAIPLAELDRFDQAHVEAPRTEFLRLWISRPGVFGAAIAVGGQLLGYGVARPCQRGWKLGPVFAGSALDARRLVGSLLARIAGEPVALDVPEPNAAGLALAADFGLKESFGCARMYYGALPSLPVARIFGVTSFEFG